MNEANCDMTVEHGIRGFDRSGLACLTDLTSQGYKQLFKRLENEQEDFLKTSASLINSSYFSKWPRDTLHWWSRIWEYPYIYYNIAKILKNNAEATPVKILDFGSGVNFFPFSMSKLGHEIICIDHDPLCIDNLNSILNSYPVNTINPVLNQAVDIPYQDETFDIIYSVSVFEHIPDLTALVSEISRVIKQQGYLIISFDVTLNNNYELTINNYNDFITKILEKFKLWLPYQPIHHADVITSENSPIPYNNPNFKSKIIFMLKNYVIKPMLLKRPLKIPLVLKLCVEGMVLKKRKNA